MVIRKGQAALDFLMTYGWAIALVVIVAAALFALGIFDAGNFIGTKAAGFSGISVQGWQMSTGGTLTLMLNNQVGQRVNVTGVDITIGSTTAPLNSTVGLLDNGASTGILSTAANAFGSQSAYNAKVLIYYTNNNGFAATSAGTLTGKAV